MFGLLSVPMGIYQARKGKKFILLLGLTIMLVGFMIPIVGLSSFALFLLTVLLLGGAIVPPIMGFATDRSSISVGFIIPLIALLYVGWTPLKNLDSSRNLSTVG